MVSPGQKAGAQKALVAVIGGLVVIINTFAGTAIDLPVEEINAVAAVLTMAGVYFVRNRGA